MNDTEAFAWMKLAHLLPHGGPGWIPWLYERLTHSDTSLEQVFRMGPRRFRQVFPELDGGRFPKLRYEHFRNINSNQVDTLVSVYRNLSESYPLYPTHPLFPTRLLQQSDGRCPTVLYARGRPEILQTPSIAFIGARRTDSATLRQTETFAAELAERGYNVLYGLANGVESAVHRGAHRVDGTTTLGLDRGIGTHCPHPRLGGGARNHLVLSPFHPGAVRTAARVRAGGRLVGRLCEAAVLVEGFGSRPPATVAVLEQLRRAGTPVYTLGKSGVGGGPVVGGGELAAGRRAVASVS